MSASNTVTDHEAISGSEDATYRNHIQVLLILPAKITSTSPRPRPMMITPILHLPIRTTARPPKPLRPVLVKLLLVPPVLRLEFSPEVVGFFGDAVAPPCAFAWGGPGDELEFSIRKTEVFNLEKGERDVRFK